MDSNLNSCTMYAEKVLLASGLSKAVSQEEIALMIQDAISYGCVKAEDMHSDYGKHVSIFDIADKEGIEIDFSASYPCNKEFVKFGEMSVKSKTIGLNSGAISIVEKELEKSGFNIDPSEIIICHEMYHYFESVKWGRYCSRYNIKRKVLGCIKIPVPLWPLSEIAANSFVKFFLDLPFGPEYLEELYFKGIKELAEKSWLY